MLKPQMSKRKDLEQRNHYLFVAADVHRNLRAAPSAYQVALHRLKNKMWGLNHRTSYRQQLKPGDRVVVYASGSRKNGRHVIGSCVVVSKPKLVNLQTIAKVDAPEGWGAVPAPYAIQLGQVRLFQTPVQLSTVRHRLSFVKNPDSDFWARCLQGGVRRISKEDYDLLVSMGTKIPKVQISTKA